MDHIVHITGSMVAIGEHRVIQRCALCGMKLVDVHCKLVLGGGRPLGTWPIGRFLVCEDGKTPYLVPGEIDGVEFPSGSCITLVE